MTKYTYTNTPSNTKWRSTAKGQYSEAKGFCPNAGWFLAIRDNNTNELIKEDFYTTQYGRDKAARRIKKKLMPEEYI